MRRNGWLSNEHYARGGPRGWTMSKPRVAMMGAEHRMQKCSSASMPKILEGTFNRVECEARAPKRLYGQSDALLRKPSAFWDSAQWCLPSRRQQAGVVPGCACRKGQANPRHNSTSNKLAGRRRIRQGNFTTSQRAVTWAGKIEPWLSPVAKRTIVTTPLGPDYCCSPLTLAL
jgi:hypothetical protein